jgi:hypothetical protein
MSLGETQIRVTLERCKLVVLKWREKGIGEANSKAIRNN